MKKSGSKIKNAFKNKAFRKRFIIIASTILLLILLAVVMYLVGKSHTVYISNVRTTVDGVTYRALNEAEVTFKKNSFTSYADFSDEVLAVGQKHTLSVDYNGNRYSKKFHIPNKYGAVIINLPVFVENPDDMSKWLTEIKITDEAPATDDSITDNSEFEM